MIYHRLRHKDNARRKYMDNTLKHRVLKVMKVVEFEGIKYINPNPWDDDDRIEQCCPVCGSTTIGKHYDNCELAALIKELTQCEKQLEKTE